MRNENFVARLKDRIGTDNLRVDALQQTQWDIEALRNAHPGVARLDGVFFTAAITNFDRNTGRDQELVARLQNALSTHHLRIDALQIGQAQPKTFTQSAPIIPWLDRIKLECRTGTQIHSHATRQAPAHFAVALQFVIRIKHDDDFVVIAAHNRQAAHFGRHRTGGGCAIGNGLVLAAGCTDRGWRSRLRQANRIVKPQELAFFTRRVSAVDRPTGVFAISITVHRGGRFADKAIGQWAPDTSGI